MSTPNAPAVPAPKASTTGAANPAAATPQGQAANPAAQPGGTQPAPAAARMIKLKLDGKEVEMPESEVISFAQQGKSATQRFQEASVMKAQAEEVLRFAKANPAEFFKKTGMNPRDWAEQYLMGELKKDSESPEQKKARENEEKLRKYEETEKETKAKAQKEEIDQLTNQKRQEFDVMFTEALKLSGLPKTAFTVKRMAELQLINLKKKLELTAPQLAKVVREDYANEQKSLIGGFDGDQLMEFLGPDAVKKLSKAQIAKLKAKGNPTSTQVQRPANQQEKGGLTWSEYQRRNRKIGR